MQKPCFVYGVRQLVLDRWELFEQILCESPFFERLTIPKGENRRLAVGVLVEELRKKGVRLEDLHQRESFNKAWTLLRQDDLQKVFYRSKESRERFADTIETANPDEFYKNYWVPIAQLFNSSRQNARKIDNILRDLFDTSKPSRPLVVLDLSLEHNIVDGGSASDSSLFPDDQEIEQQARLFWNEDIQALIIKRLLEGIRFVAESAYKQNQSLNTLVLMDEAHRLAPREEPESEEKKAIRSLLIDSVRTTRKYGVGWMFISQTLSSLHREIIEQLRIFFFGFGLGMGAEFRALSELVGGRGTALDLYQLFRDPHSSFDFSSREYSFMTIGPVSPLSFAGTPLFFNAFNNPNEFLRVNNL